MAYYQQDGERNIAYKNTPFSSEQIEDSPLLPPDYGYIYSLKSSFPGVILRK